jgi:uncharacterized protein (UPF0335 family)
MSSRESGPGGSSFHTQTGIKEEEGSAESQDQGEAASILRQVLRKRKEQQSVRGHGEAASILRQVLRKRKEQQRARTRGRQLQNSDRY